jgi:hypothetical protein
MKSMEQALFNARGEPVAYISVRPRNVIFLWDGRPVAFVYGRHIYGFTGVHLGWFVKGVVYDAAGKRVGFTASTAPLPACQEPPKAKKRTIAKIQPRQEAPSSPELQFTYSEEDFETFLQRGEVGLP